MKLTGHSLQFLGYMLTFLGLAIVGLAMFAAVNAPQIPMWAFLGGSCVIAAPLMIAGGRINSRGRGIVLDIPPEQAKKEYRQQTILLAYYLGFLWSIGLLAAAPLVSPILGLGFPNTTFFSLWLTAWMLVFCGGRTWVTRPLWKAIERRVLRRLSSGVLAMPPEGQPPLVKQGD